jgi:hypothetical protein
MASTIGKVAAVFTASTSGLTAGMRSAGASMKSLSADVAALRSNMRTLTAIAGAQLFTQVAGGALSAARSMIDMGQAAADTIDSTSKLSARLGMTYGELSGLAYAGSLADVSMETLGKAATKADIAFVKASQGSAIARAAFDGIGLSVDALQGKTPAERFQAIADAIGGLPSEAERAAASVRLFGKAGTDLLPLFAGGAGAIGEATAEAQAFGLALTNAQGQDVEAMNDAFTRAGAAIQGIVTQVTAYLAPSIKGVADTFTQLVGDAGGATIGQRIGDGILEGARFLAGIGDFLITNLGGVFEYLSGVGEQWNSIVDFFNRAGAFLSGVFNAAQAGLGLIVLGFSGSFEKLATIAQSIGKYLGFDTKSIDSIAAGSKAFNDEIANGIEANMAKAAEDFGRALGDGGNQNSAGAAIAGPLTTALDEAIAKAKASAAVVDQAKAQDITAAVQPPAKSNAALTAVDSRSKEGIAEMFRLMRGDTQDIQAQQLAVQERIADGIEELGDSELEVLSMGY